jgi:hypothetical protein
MHLIQRLQDKQEGLEEEYELLSKKLRRLRKGYVVEVDPATKLKLEVQIAETQEEIDGIEQELDEIEQQIKGASQVSNEGSGTGIDLNRLHSALLKLGYWEQQRSFKRIIKEFPLGAFLIQGASPEYGQRWLLNRLVLEISKTIEGKVIKVDLGRIVSRSDVPALWRELAGRVGLGRQSSPAEIVDRVHQWWQTQNILIIFYDVHCTAEENLRDLINDFWAVLANRLSNSVSQKSSFKLLLFLLDYKACVCTWNLSFAKQFDSSWKPTIPIGLPDIVPFAPDVLITWLEHQSDDLPSQLTDDIETTVETILSHTENGVPEPTLREICGLCGCNWYDQEEKWLKL